MRKELGEYFSGSAAVASHHEILTGFETSGVAFTLPYSTGRSAGGFTL